MYPYLNWNFLKILKGKPDTELTCNKTVLLGYIKNDFKKFKVFEVNCVQLIGDHTDVKHWHYVNTADNPADLASRDLDISQKEKVDKWFQKPQCKHFGTIKLQGVCITQIF